MAKVAALLIGIALLGVVSVSSGQAGISRVGTNSIQFACPDGHFQYIIVTITTKFRAVDAPHTNWAQFNVEVNGLRLATITNSIYVIKGGAKGHYWGYETYAVSQKMINYMVLPGNSVSVNFLNGEQHISSDIRVDLSN
ncbi:uncharacterized protein LOC113210583 [Frankliniella occidentalis]|uniref:Uncharacterized protein LOC113210583 n=1 Tax=Frankliniella occidentalis TaxID=133901 RepID=A0A6J1SU89_FRAOC|nr:uncharacterized protein LOC113210583 [Frankliniella occidentalis]